MSGIFAVSHHNEDPAFEDIYYGLYALQHRGQETVGIATSNGTTRLKIGQGLIKDNLSSSDAHFLTGGKGIGHVENDRHGVEMPIVLDNAILTVDGVISNEDFSMIDLMVHLRNADEECLAYLDQLEGGFALCYMEKDRLIATRDKRGIKPLVMGYRGSSFVVSSESCGIDVIGGECYRDIAPGEIIIQNEDGLKSYNRTNTPAQVCAFEYIYFARQDSIMDSESVYNARYQMGVQLANEENVRFDSEETIIIGAPDSGIVAAMGYANGVGIPYQQGFVRNHYIGRTFTKPNDLLRAKDVCIKLTPIRSNLKGKHVILVDDSIIRGTTIHETVKDILQVGAKSVHVRIASPPVINRSKDSGSIKVPDVEDLFAYQRTLEEMNELIGSDSLAFLSIEGLRKACNKQNLYDPYFKENE